MPYIKDYKPGQEVEVEGWIVQPSWSDNATFAQTKMGDHGYVCIAPYTLRFKVPDYFNAVVAEVESIDQALEAKAQEYHAFKAQAQARKNELLQLAAPDASEVMDANPGQKFIDVESVPVTDDFPF